MELSLHTETKPTSLFCLYPSQDKPQPAYIELACQTGWFGADYNAEIGTAVPAKVWHGHTRRYPIPLLRGSTVNALLAQLAPLAQRVLDGYASEWTGHNHVAILDDDAQAAEEAITDILDDYGEGDLNSANAGDWLYDIKSDLREQLANGATVESLVEELQGDGTGDKPYLAGLYTYLENLKEAAND